MKIKLTGFVDLPELTAGMGTVVEVTDDLKKVADFLVANRAAYVLPEETATAEPAPQVAPTEGDSEEDDPADNADLSGEDTVDKLADFGIHGRYVKALKDASITTIAQVKERSAKLSDVAGISDAAAKQIQAVLAEELDE